jgi:hypothetical protein
MIYDLRMTIYAPLNPARANPKSQIANMKWKCPSRAAFHRLVWRHQQPAAGPRALRQKARRVSRRSAKNRARKSHCETRRAAQARRRRGFRRRPAGRKRRRRTDLRIKIALQKAGDAKVRLEFGHGDIDFSTASTSATNCGRRTTPNSTSACARVLPATRRDFSGR